MSDPDTGLGDGPDAVADTDAEADVGAVSEFDPETEAVGRDGTEGPRPIYNVPFSWDSSHGHVVELLVVHAAPGLIVDIGCGYAPHAERLAQRGFEYVGVDADPDAVAHLRDRDFRAALADANDADALLAALDVVAGRSADGAAPISAVLALDVLEHLSTPDRTLAAVAGWMKTNGASLLAVSLPNITHQDVVLKLLAGRFDLTPSGLLDHTHLRWFSDATVTSMLASVGMTETARHDVTSPKSDQDWPEFHPLLSDGALLGRFLRNVRSMTDAHGETFQFVRLYTADPLRPVSPTLLADRPPAPELALTVVVAPRCTDTHYSELCEQLEAQTSRDFDVVRTYSDTEVADAFAGAAGAYVSILSGDEHLAANWVAQFLAVAERYPGSAVRCDPLAEAPSPDHDVDWGAGFDLFAHLVEERTPGAAFAFPTAFLRDLATNRIVRGRGATDGTVSDVARLNTHALIVEASAICGVVESGVAAVAPRTGWRAADGAAIAEAARQRLAVAPMLTPFGAADEIADLLANLRAAQVHIGELDTALAVLRAGHAELEADRARLAAELDRRSVRLARKATTLAARLRPPR